MPIYVPGLADYATPPYTFDNLTSATFILTADANKLQQVCDVFLNGPLGRTAAKGFVPGGAPRVLICCSTFPIAEASPLQPFGFSAYREVTVLFSVFDRLNRQWGWYVPLLYIDGPVANVEEWQAELPIAVGREMYGLPKTRGEIDFAADHTGEMRRIDPKVPTTKVDLSLAVKISLGACSTLTEEDALATQENELLGLTITEQQMQQEGVRGRPIVSLRRKIESLRRETARLRKSSDKIAEERREARLDLFRLQREPRKRELLTPKAMIDMLWGGDPYETVGFPRPVEEDEWLESLGFFKRKRRGAVRGTRLKKKARRILMARSGPIETAASEPQGDYEFAFFLLGLRQLHDPAPANFGQAMIQHVVRTELRFNQLPWKPVKIYCVEVKDSPVARLLGIGPQKHTVVEIHNFTYKDGGRNLRRDGNDRPVVVPGSSVIDLQALR